MISPLLWAYVHFSYMYIMSIIVGLKHITSYIYTFIALFLYIWDPFVKSFSFYQIFESPPEKGYGICEDVVVP